MFQFWRKQKNWKKQNILKKSSKQGTLQLSKFQRKFYKNCVVEDKAAKNIQENLRTSKKISKKWLRLKKIKNCLKRNWIIFNKTEENC